MLGAAARGHSMRGPGLSAEEQDTQHLKGPDVPLERRSLALEPAPLVLR